MTETLALILSAVCIIALAFFVWLMLRQFDKERREWQTERSQLLDRIQAGSFNEYKAQERADTPIKRKEKDPIMARLDGEPWL